MAETFPSWRYGPDGEAKVCLTADDVPAGWTDHPAKTTPKEPARRGNNRK